MAGINLGPNHDFAIRLQRMQDQIDALSTRDVLQNASITQGGLTVSGGGSITVSGTGSLNVASGGLNSAGSITAATTINSGSDVNVGGNGNVNFNNGTVYSIYALNNAVVTGYFALYVNSDGRFGRTVSARRYKQDIANFTPSLQAVFALQLRAYRLKQAVEEHGDAAPFEHGLIAEELMECGLDWLVQFGPDGRPEAIAYEKVALALIPVIQDHEMRLLRLEGHEHT